jgi:hypothetical protein
MTPLPGHATAINVVPPFPVVLPYLNEALKRFRGSHYGTNLAIHLFEQLLIITQ